MTSTKLELFIKSNTQLIIDSNNNVETLNKSRTDYEEIKLNTDLNNHENKIFCMQFETVLKLGFKRVGDRKIELLDKRCPFALPF